MESFPGSGFGMTTSVATRRRSNTSRRPRTDPHLFREGRDTSTTPTTPSSDDVSKQSTESGSYDSNNQRKIFSLNTTNLKTSSINKLGGVNASIRVRKEEKFGGQPDRNYGISSSRSSLSGSGELGRNRSDLKRCTENAVGPSSRLSSGDFKENREVLLRSPDNYLSYGGSDAHISSSVGNVLSGSAENKLRKVRLKVGGVTHTLHAKSSIEGGSSNASVKPPRSSEASRHRLKFNLQEISDNDHSSSRGASWKGFREGSNTFSMAKEGSRGKSTDETLHAKQGDVSEPVRKSKRIPKKRVLDGAFNEEDEDDEIRYLERLKISRINTNHYSEQEGNTGDNNKNKKRSKNSKNRPVYEEDDDFALSQRSADGRRKSRSDMESEDVDFIEEDEQGSDDGPENKQRKSESMDSPDTTDDKKLSLTTRQRALQSSKDGAGGNGTLIEFPNGLPPAAPRKQKGKLSEVEQQLKKVEAAQRRRMQVEKAARESEAEAIRKILGQDSSRKKREDKLRKKREELAQGRTSNSALAPNYVRWVIGPNGTTVMFSEGAGLPSIFNSTPSRYPPPREKCAGPSCTNAYKYRDSKSNLPLCSLQCYRAVQQSSQQLAAC